MSGYTPGPWSLPHFAEPDVNCECGYVLTDGYMGAVCTVHASGEGGCVDTGDNPRFAEAVANARLIASGPDLLEALIMALPYVETAEHDDGYTDGAAARVVAVMGAAIAKATEAAS